MADHVNPEYLEGLLTRAGTSGVRCWAVTESKKSIFNSMQRGSDIFFTTAGTGLMTHYARAIDKIHNPALGKALWPYTPGQAWEYIYFLRGITRIKIPKPYFVRMFGFKENFNISGATRISERRLRDHGHSINRVWKILGVARDVEDIQLPESPEPEDLAELWDPSAREGLDLEILAKRRRNHDWFAKAVKSNYNWRCAVTGIAERSFLVASHILPWARFPDSRLDPANGICLSPFFDRAFDQGFFTLDSRYQIKVSPLVTSDSALGHHLLQVDNQPLTLPKVQPPDLDYLHIHQEEIFLK